MASLCLQEVVISGSPEDETMHLWELHTATTLVSYRPASPSCFAAAVPVGRDLFAVSQPGKPALHVFNWRRDMPQARMSLPERLVALAASPDGAHVLGGGEGGRVFMWEVAGGAMLRTWEAHYRAVTAIAFTDDGSHVITASEDSLVRAWSVGALLDYSASSHLPPTPVVTWNQHTLPVSALAVGAGGAAARILSASLDRSVRVWHLPSNSCLASASFPSAIHSLVLHPCEHTLYAGGADGVIYAADLASPVLAVGGNSLAVPQKMPGHAGAVLALSLSMDGSMLVSGSRDGTAKVWDCASGQAVKTFTQHTGAVTVVRTMLRPPQMLDGAHLKSGTLFAQLAKRVELDCAADSAVFAGPGRSLNIMVHPVSDADEGRRALGVDRSLLLSASDEGGDDAMEGDGSAGVQEEMQRWKGAAEALHKIVSERVVPPGV